MPGPRLPSYCRPAPGEPHEAVFLVIELRGSRVTGRRILPDRIAVLMKEKRGIAGIFRAKVNGARQKRRPQNRGWPESRRVLRRDLGLAKREQHHFAQQPPFEIEFRADRDGRRGIFRPRGCRGGDARQK